MAATRVYRTPVQPDWIDYNGHLRDAYYVLVLSLATDALMDRIGLDAAYRERTGCTLYSLEMHLHWLAEIKGSDTIEVDAHLLDADRKRLLVGFDVRVAGREGSAATGEFVFLHFRQGASPGSAPFPPEVEAAIASLRPAPGAPPWAGPGSRALALAKR
jgi:acyl-CoA thioesterase FadM